MVLAAGDADNSRLAYVDGLRAVAVLLVLLFHFGIVGFSNGFLGVDIFFVISGFVVTRMIMGRVTAGQFRWTDFYIARFLRIAPALFFWTGISIVVAALLFLPAARTGAANAAIASIIFLSNRHSYNNYNYFDHDLVKFPMLHHWSLAVEMQFYLLTPLLLVFGYRYLGRKGLAIVAGLLGLWSAMQFQLEWQDNLLRAFYLPTMRAWEYLAGSLVALTNLSHFHSPARAALRWFGAFAVIAGIFLGTGFSILTIVPVVVGTALILAGCDDRHDALMRRSLERWPMVALGRISYSVYLAHWPILIFVQYWWIEPLPLLMRASLLLLSIIVGWLSWMFIEQRFRPVRTSYKATWMQIRVVFVAGAAIMAFALLLRLHPQPEESLAQLGQSPSGISPERQNCHASISADPATAARACILGARVAPDIAVWGDSHGVELSFALGEVLRRTNRSMLQKTTSSCPPWAGLTITINPRCREQNDRILHELAANPSVKTVVLVMYRRAYGERDSAIAASIRRSIRVFRAAGKRVLLIGPYPNPQFHVPDGRARARIFWPDNPLDPIMRDDHLAANAGWASTLSEVAAAEKVQMVDPARWMCRANGCPRLLDDRPQYFDDNHPTFQAVAGVASHLAAIPVTRP